jgi:Flp pilus assembly protein TadG
MVILLPGFFILALGTIELCQYFFVRQSAVIVAYEGARLAVRSRSDGPAVIERCEEMLLQRRIVEGQVAVSPPDLMSIPSGTRVNVTVEVPHARNSPTFFLFKNLGAVSVTAIMLRE